VFTDGSKDRNVSFLAGVSVGIVVGHPRDRGSIFWSDN